MDSELYLIVVLRDETQDFRALKENIKDQPEKKKKRKKNS